MNGELKNPSAACRRVDVRAFEPAAGGKRLVKMIAGRWFKERLTRLAIPPGARLILMYHQVVPGRAATDHRAGMEVTAATLTSHLSELGRYFELVPLTRIIEPEPNSRPLCALTFDDGWRDNFEVAFPVLRQFKAPATIFLPAALIGTSRRLWFARLWELVDKACAEGEGARFMHFFMSRLPGWARPGMAEEQLSALITVMLERKGAQIEEILDDAFRYLDLPEDSGRQLLSWKEAACMGREGITFGSHGLRHYALPPLSRREKEEEIGGPLAIMREKGLPMVPFFCFPNGKSDQESFALLTEAGYRGGVTTEMGCNFEIGDPFRLQRIAVHDQISSTSSLLWFRFRQAGLSGSRRKA